MNESPFYKARYAILLVAVIALAAGFVWIVLKDSSEDRASSITTEPAKVPVAKKPEPAKLAPTQDKALPAKDASNPKTTSAVRPQSDFRVDDPDKYASVKDGNFFTTTDVEELVPESPSERFKVGQRVYAYAELRAPNNETVHISWYDAGGEIILPSSYLDVKTNTSAVGYRIYTYRIFRDPGRYSVAVFNSPGGKLAEQAFTVE